MPFCAVLASHTQFDYAISEMRVKTKYGYGTLIGMCANNSGDIGYKVLRDNPNPLEMDESEKKFFKFRKSEDRIYHCLWIEVLSDEGEWIKLSGNLIQVK